MLRKRPNNFDERVDFWTATLAKKLKKNQVQDKFISLEKTVFKVVKVLTVVQAMYRRVYFFDLMRIKRISELSAKLKQNYVPTCPTAYDD